MLLKMTPLGPTDERSDANILANYVQLVTTSEHPATLSDPSLPDNPIVACSKAFLNLTGYARDEVIGRNCRFLSDSRTSPVARAQLREAISSLQPTLVEILNYRKDGTPFINAVMIAPVFNARGQLLAFIGSQSEVRKGGIAPAFALNKRLAERMRALTARQREVLFALASGKQIKQIAFELQLNERTVKLHREAAVKALGAANTIEAIRIAIQAGY
jgi:PAS domain S-box-containing protein